MHAWFAAILLAMLLRLPRSDSADRVPCYIVISSLVLSLLLASIIPSYLLIFVSSSSAQSAATLEGNQSMDHQ